MDKVKLFDKVVSVGLSKFPEIQIPIKNVSLREMKPQLRSSLILNTILL